MLTLSQFSDIRSRCFSILSEFVGKKDTYDLSPRIHFTLGKIYEEFSFSEIDSPQIQVSKCGDNRNMYWIKFSVYTQYPSGMEETHSCEFNLDVGSDKKIVYCNEL
jgi:hypothetical protein